MQINRDQCFLSKKRNRLVLEVLERIIDRDTGTGDTGTAGVSLNALIQNDTMDDFTGLCQEKFDDRWKVVPDMSTCFVFVH